jgi:hypothetical protein
VADLDAQRAHRIVDDRRLVGAEEQQSPLTAPVRASTSCSAWSCRFLTIGDCRPSRPFATSLTLIQARPFAP